MKNLMLAILLLSFVLCFSEGTLFVGLSSSSVPTYTSDMQDFPNITWEQHFTIEVDGAAATPDGMIYLCEGAFTTHLYQAGLDYDPQQICTTDEAMSALAYGRETLWGYANYASPRGIYSINTNTGAVELAVDVGSYRFFGLDYNPEDDLLYGYTEYGTSGLYSINIDTGEMIFLTGSIPASNGQGRALAVGDNTAYLAGTRGDDDIPYFAYDLSQGAGGEWVEFTNPYPEYHSSGGAAWVAAPETDVMVVGTVFGSDDPEAGLEGCEVVLAGEEFYQTTTNENGEFVFEEVEMFENYAMEISCEGYDSYTDAVEIENVDLDLGEIFLTEAACPPQNVLALITVMDEIVTVMWDAPREFESYTLYRFMEDFNTQPEYWQMLAEETEETEFVDYEWMALEAGRWQYAVVALYTNGVLSEPAFSNVVVKNVISSDESVIELVSNISAYPNPFNPRINIAYNIDTAMNIDVSIYNVKGEFVKNLKQGWHHAGSFRTSWDGNDVSGNNASSGVYFIRFTGNEKSFATERIILMK